MNRFILLGGILIAAWFVFMAVFPLFPYSAWHAFFLSCENLNFDWYERQYYPDCTTPRTVLPCTPYPLPPEPCPSFGLEASRVVVMGVTAVLLSLASWSFWKGTRD
jgi:hypothetical protein